MNPPRFAVFVFLFFAATVVAQPFVERPLATPVYGPAEYDQRSPAIASNGTDFLVAWMDSRPISQVFAARFTKAGEILDRPIDRIALSSCDLPQSGASLLSRGNGRIAAVYARVAIEPEYGSVMRVFAADAPSRRIRTVRRH